MNRILETIKPELRALDAYTLKERQFEVKLNQNESPFDLPANMKQELWQEFQERAWNRYPSFGNQPLLQSLADKLGLEPDSLLVGNGSNELLQCLVSATLCTGKRALAVTPTFAIYDQLVRVAGAELLQVRLTDDWIFPEAEIIETIVRENVDLCILCVPNSPTGSALDGESLAEILDAAPGLVLVDEAYCEFSQNDNLSLLGSHPNLILTRTFSKALGLAGLRIGYMISSPELITEINKAKLPYNLNIFSELVAMKLLEAPDLVAQNVERILAERQRVMETVNAIDGAAALPSDTNFFMLETHLLAGELFERLLSRGVLVRDISKYDARLANKVRVTIGKPAENERFLAALRESLGVERGA